MAAGRSRPARADGQGAEAGRPAAGGRRGRKGAQAHKAEARRRRGAREDAGRGSVAAGAAAGHGGPGGKQKGPANAGAAARASVTSAPYSAPDVDDGCCSSSGQAGRGGRAGASGARLRIGIDIDDGEHARRGARAPGAARALLARRPLARRRGTDARLLPPPPAPRARARASPAAVLASYLPVVNSYHNSLYSTSFRVGDYFVYDYKQVWGCSQQESNERVHEFYSSHEFLNTVEPIPGAVAAVARLRREHDLVIVTSRQLVIEEATRAWIARHFPPGTFSSINFGNAYALTGPQRTKAEICVEQGCQVLIDDNPKYVRECADAGIDTLLFDHELAYAWSKPAGGAADLGARDAVCDGNERITRVADWAQVEEWILKRSRSSACGQPYLG